MNHVCVLIGRAMFEIFSIICFLMPPILTQHIFPCFFLVYRVILILFKVRLADFSKYTRKHILHIIRSSFQVSTEHRSRYSCILRAPWSTSLQMLIGYSSVPPRIFKNSFVHFLKRASVLCEFLRS